ncbi:MAG: Trk system potassium transporter TrkA [Rikenellaceae bacterium]|jgi:trk system potassium uptake protein TrkA|nr:Trk system potassium transporter TrkA [Rikenellaceae bacterium]
MRILIAGAGEVGTHLARMLSNVNHEVTIIDEDPKKLEEIAASTDILSVEGDFTTFEVLNKASARKADLFLAVSQDENANILAASIAKNLGAKKAISRVDHIEYMQPGNKEVFLNMGVDYLFYPEQMAADEVINLLGHNRSSEFVDFSGGKLALVVYKLDESSPLPGNTLLEVTEDRNVLKYRTVAISRDGETIIPRGSDDFRVGDTIYVIVDERALDEVMAFSGKTKVNIKNLMILGGSRIGIAVAKALQDHVNVKLIEYKEDKAYKLTELLEKTLIIHEDGRNTAAMMDEGLSSMDAFVSVTGRSETNILTAMLAKRMGVKKVVAAVENLNYINLAESIGIDTLVNKKRIAASNIFRFTMNTDVQAIKCLTGSEAEVLEFIAKPESPVTKKPIRELQFPKDAIIGGIVRADETFIAVGSFEIKPYDRVVVFALPDAIGDIGEYFR